MRGTARYNQKRINYETVTISGATTSSEIALTGRTLCGISVASIATAVSCTFTVATATGGTFRTLSDKDGTAYTVTLAAGEYNGLDPSVFAGVEFIKIVLNASGDLSASLHIRNME